MAVAKYSANNECWEGVQTREPSSTGLGIEMGNTHLGGYPEDSFNHENENEIRKHPNTKHKINTREHKYLDVMMDTVKSLRKI